MSNVGEFSWNWILEDQIQVSFCCFYILHEMCLREFNIVQLYYRCAVIGKKVVVLLCFIDIFVAVAVVIAKGS